MSVRRVAYCFQSTDVSAPIGPSSVVQNRIGHIGCVAMSLYFFIKKVVQI